MHVNTLFAQVSLLAKLPCRAQTAVLHALQYADYDPGELIIREGVSYLLSVLLISVLLKTAWVLHLPHNLKCLQRVVFELHG